MAKSGVTDLNATQSSVIIGPVDVVQPDGSLLHVTVDASALPSGAATAANQATGNASLASIDNKLTSPITVTGPLTDVQLRATPVPISGTVTALGPLTDAELRASPVPVTASISGTPNVNVANGAGASAVNIQDGGNTITVDGTVGISGSVAVTGPLTDSQLRASPVDVNVTSVVASNVTVTNGAGASAVNIQDGGNSITVDGTVAVSNFPATQPVSGTVTANQGGTWSVTATQATGSNLHTVVDSGTITSITNPVAVTGPLTDTELRATPVPISGTVTANIGTTNGLALDATLTGGNQRTRITDGTDTALVTTAGELNVIATAQPGIDIGDVTVNNGAGASAVNIQDGGNSITVDNGGTFAVQASQSGTWNINNVSGTVSLPTGASTSALQTSGNASLTSIDGKLPTLATSAPLLSASAIPVRPIPYEPTSYSAVATAFTPAALATDVFTITGSGSKTIYVHSVEVSGTTTSGSPIKITINLIRRSAANTGGTTVAITPAKHDSTNANAAATAVYYTVNPAALGASAGTIRSTTTSFQASGVTDTNFYWDFADDGGQQIVLRGTSEILAINFNATTVTGGVVSICVEWSEA